MITLKICLLFLCLLPFRAVGTPRIQGATFFMENLEGEIWKDIVGFESFYQISSHGRLRSIDRKVFNKANGTESLIKGVVMKMDNSGKKYLQAGLAKESKYKKVLIHRLVAIAFVPNPENKPEVNHIDCDKPNNHYKNLEWSTRLENARHAKKEGRYSNMNGLNRPNRILDSEAVAHIRRKELRGFEYCKLYGVKPSTICCIQNPQKYKGRWRNVT